MNTILADRVQPAAYDDGPGKTGTIMIWDEDAPRQVEWRWGFKPIEPGGRSVSLLRREGRAIVNPCLIIANDFGLKVDGKMKYRASLIGTEPFFCIAGVWRPATGDWPESFAALTTQAYPDIAPFKDRHVAIIRPEDWYHWLQLSKTVDEMLRPFPLGSFAVTTTRGRRAAPQSPATGDLFDW